MSMPRRSKARRALKWIGTLVCVATLGLWLISIRAPGWMGWGLVGLGVQYGRVILWINQVRGEGERAAQAERLLRQAIGHGWEFNEQPCPWTDVGSYGLVLPSVRREDPFKTFHSRADRNPHVQWLSTTISLPCWLLSATTVLPTSFVWWRDRRITPRGHCQRCGYDLTGNVSGRCPECGETL